MKELSIEELEVMMCSTGYLPPRNDDELSFFNQLYEGYNSRLKDKHVDIDAIFNGSCRIVPATGYVLEPLESSNLMVAEDPEINYSMAARNFSKLPKTILDKMKNQHITPKDEE